MQIHKLIQGSQSWLDYRRNHFNASDAGSMLGESPYKTRSALLKEYATGIVEEIDSATQERFDEGHRTEALARALIESETGIDLYPVIGSMGRLSASFDGLTLDEKFVYEHKTLNNVYRTCQRQEELPVYLRAQIEQQIMIADADAALFHATKWEGDLLIEEVRIQYFPDMALRERIIQGWTQFSIDLENYAPTKVIEEKPESKAVLELPALVLRAEGKLVNSNMEAFGVALKEHLAETRKMVYVTDQDFADADKRAKMYRETCKKLELAKESMLAQTVSIDEAFRLIDVWHEDLRTTALQIEKDVAKNTDLKKQNIINEAKIGFIAFIAELEKIIAPIRLIYTVPNFAEAIKGKRLFSAMHDAVQTMLANTKIEYNATATGIRANLDWLNQHSGYMFLFNDLQNIVYKQADDFQLLINSRIAEHQRLEAVKLEEARQKAIDEERARVEAAAAIEAAKVKEAEEQRQRAEADKLLAEKIEQAPIKTHDDHLEPVIAKTLNFDAQQETVKEFQQHPASTPPTLRLGQIGERLGFNVTADFLAKLGVVHAAKEKSSILYHESHFPIICMKLVDHISGIYQQHKKAA